MKRRSGFPKVDKHGVIRIASVNHLSYENLRRWVEAVLQGEDPGAGAERHDPPHVFLHRVYRQLDPGVREALRDVLLFELGDLAQNPRTHWQGDEGNELLLLVGSIFGGSQRAEAPVDLLLYIATNNRSFDDSKPTLRWRALQTLTAVGHRAPPSFWHAQYELGGEDYAMVTLAGLSLTNLEEVSEWLLRELANEAVLSALVSLLPWLTETHPANDVSGMLRRLISAAPEPYRRELQLMGRRLELDVSPKPEATLFVGWPTVDIPDLFRQLGLELTLQPSTATERLFELEQPLRQLANQTALVQSANADIQVIVGIYLNVIRKGITLSVRLREWIWEHGSRILPSIVTSEEEAFGARVALASIGAGGVGPERQLDALVQEDSIHDQQ